LKRQAQPPISFDLLTITTIYPGASPEDVEINVTNKIEDQLRDIENIKSLTSMSMENISIVYAQIDSDSGDPSITKTSIRDAIGRVSSFPDGVKDKPIIDELKASSMPVIELSISGNIPEKELRKYAKDLEDRLRIVPGVGKLAKTGYRKREIKIEVDKSKMLEYQIPFSQVISAIRARNVRLSGGTLESFVSEKNIITLSEYENLKDVQDVIVRANFSGNHVLISDIAKIEDSFEEPRILYRGNGKPAIALLVKTQDNADIIKLSKGLQEVLEEFQSELPENVKADMIFDFSIYTSMMIDMVLKNGIFGFVLVFLVMFFFLDLKSAFWCAFGIPFSILGSLILFPVFGLSLDNTSLVTMILLLGIVVDDSIVITEKVYSLKKTISDKLEATTKAVRGMILPVTAAILTTILAFLPILFMGGIFGKFLYAIPVVVLLTLCFSWIESHLFLPSHIMHADPPKLTKRGAFIDKLVEVYHKMVTRALQNKWKVLVGFIIGFISLMSLSIASLDFTLNTEKDSDFFTVTIEAPTGYSLEKTSELTSKIEKELFNKIPKEVFKSMSSTIGHHDSPFAGSMGQYSYWAMITIYLIPAQERDLETENLIEELKPPMKELKEKLGLEKLHLGLMGESFNSGKPVDITFMSNDDKVRTKFEKELMEYLKGIDGVSNIETTTVGGKDELSIKLDYNKLGEVGLTAIDVATSVRTAYDGILVTSVRKQGEEIDYRVKLNHIKDENLLDLPISNYEGRLIPLGYVAKLEEKKGIAVLYHENGTRSVRITADVDKEKLTSVKINEMIKVEFQKKVNSISGLRMKFGGQEMEMMISMKGFYFSLTIAVIAIYFILVVIFDSYRQPFLIMTVIPFAVLGVLLTLLMHNLPITFIALIGLLGLIGVVVNDTIVMISHLNNLCSEKGLSIETISEGARDRFRPVILTTLTTFAGLFPTSYGIGGDIPEIRPLILTMAWGLVFCTVVTLFFIPTIYSLIKKVQKSYYEMD
ncbi:MAG: efflux RND transporter permease subunit, partial [Leptospiraceae bacterium]|nr:efflux RND transporter permease subunit [Leptospiraceae bacterium]